MICILHQKEQNLLNQNKIECDNSKYWAEWNKMFNRKFMIFRSSHWCHFWHNQICSDWLSKPKHLIPTYIYLKGDIKKYSVWKKGFEFLISTKYLKLDSWDWINPLFRKLYELRIKLFIQLQDILIKINGRISSIEISIYFQV